MNDTTLISEASEEFITVPSFLLAYDNYGIATASDCIVQMGDCGVCQGFIEECGYSEYGVCSACEGAGGQACYSEQTCSQSGCDDCMDCLGEGCGSCLCAGGQGQYPCSQSCSECGSCEDCMDCMNSCQNSIQSQIDPWDWFANDETTSAYYAVAGQGLVSSFSANVWNDLVDRVRDVRKLMNVSPQWDEEYANYYDTRMSAVDKILTAVRFNSLWYNIKQLHEIDTIDQQSRGQTVYGHYFTDLTTALNVYINSL